MLPTRKSPRADFHDYSSGDYFVTVCTLDWKQYFGRIIGDQMHFSAIGKFCNDALATLENHYPYVEVPVFTVMPNHIHAIVCMKDNVEKPQNRTALGVVIGGLKQHVTVFARRNNIHFAWQPRYHDHIIRSHDDGNKIADYINTNIIRWSCDRFYSK